MNGTKAKGKGKNGQSHRENQFIWVTKKIDLDRIEHEVTDNSRTYTQNSCCLGTVSTILSNHSSFSLIYHHWH